MIGARIRDAMPEDLNYIMGTWLGSHLSNFPGRNRASARRSFQAYSKTLLLSAPKISVMVSGRDVLHAWAMAEPGKMLHFAYVPKDLWGNGLGRQVITAAFGSYPERIACSYRWPYASSRFVFKPVRRVA